MNQSQDSSNKTSAQQERQDQQARDNMTNEGGRSGGEHARQGGGQSDKSRQQGSPGSQDIEREKADKGQGSPA